jgi:hypothetical protein
MYANLYDYVCDDMQTQISEDIKCRPHHNCELKYTCLFLLSHD